jgi:Domain of unknown function (DUF4180)
VSACIELPPWAASGFEPAAVIAMAVESGARGLLADADALPPGFFDLSTGIAGDLAQRLTLYDIRLAAVVPDPAIHSAHFQDFAREANRGVRIRFFPDRDGAVGWLDS